VTRNTCYGFRAFLFLVPLVLLLTTGTSRAHANEATLTIGLRSDNLSDRVGPYGPVTVDLTSPTTATRTFTSDRNYELKGKSRIVDLEVNAATFSDSVPPDLSTTDSGHADGFGIFNLMLKGLQGGTNQISISLTNTSGTWTSATDGLTKNGKRYYVAAHIAVDSAGARFTSTGFAGDRDPPIPTLEPATMLLFGSGLLLVGGIVRWQLHR
jgi:hypothetical protein